VANLIAVKLFGEMEFWFALIKVMAIVLLLVLGVAILVFGVGPLGQTASVSNLFSHGGFFPVGIVGVVFTLQIAMFAFTGVELIGVTAGEADNPQEVLPKATNSITYRILLFYIGSLVILMSLVAWNEYDPKMSPFVAVFDKMGIPYAAGIINFVVLTAAASSCNSGIFSTGRMLYTLSHFGQAPKMFGEVSAQHVPSKAITVSVIMMLIGVVLNYLVPEEVFTYVTSVATVGAIWTWGVIMFAHMGYRKSVRLGESKPVAFRMPGGMLATAFVLLFLAAGTIMLAFDAGNRVALYIAPIWFGLLTVAYRMTQSKSKSGAGLGKLAAQPAR